MRRKAIAVAVGAAALLALAGCSGNRTGTTIAWKASATCASPSEVGSTAQLAQMTFTVKNAVGESPADGCSYLASGGKTELNVDIVPGPPSSSEQFGTAVALKTTKLPSLGPGAESATSATFCALLAPATGGNTIQLQLIGAKADLAAPCGRLTELLNDFATKTVTSS